jgi:hypothetical protein
MAAAPSVAIKLFGTDAPPAPIRVLRAGPLSAQFDNGALRYIKMGDVEVIRAIAYVVRDENWGTLNPEIDNLQVDERADGFTVMYDAVCRDARHGLKFSAQIVARADGRLRFEATGEALTDFHTRRVGFVILHALDGVAGCPVEVLHVDGKREQSVFPALVEPWQPFFDIRALITEPVPGLKVTCTMEGDTWEMEDHRNWTDASYKTYVRPLAEPAPYVLEPGAPFTQSVSLAVDGTAPASAGDEPAPVQVTLGAAEAGSMPDIGLGVHPRDAAAALEVVDLVQHMAPRHLVCHFDPRDGHDAHDLRRFQSLSDALGSPLVLEAVVPCEGDYREEIKAIAAAVAEAGARFVMINAAPGPDMLAGVPFSDFPKVPPLGDLYDAMRAAFPDIPVGGGSFSYFTELNRRRPPIDKIDHIGHATCAIVHAADDVSVTETLTALPHVIQSVRAFAGDTPYRIGPAGIGTRHAPFGGEPTANPGDIRVTMCRNDPRQRGLLGAAWHLGYLAHTARGGVEAVTLSAPVGAFGICYRKMDYAQPWYDDSRAPLYPAFHVVAGLAPVSGAPVLATTSSAPRDIQALAYRHDGSTVLWLANLVSEAREVGLAGLAGTSGSLRTLDQATFEACAGDPGGFAGTARTTPLDRLVLAPYAVVRIETLG